MLNISILWTILIYFSVFISFSYSYTPFLPRYRRFALQQFHWYSHILFLDQDPYQKSLPSITLDSDAKFFRHFLGRKIRKKRKTKKSEKTKFPSFLLVILTFQNEEKNFISDFFVFLFFLFFSTLHKWWPSFKILMAM